MKRNYYILGVLILVIGGGYLAYRIFNNRAPHDFGFSETNMQVTSTSTAESKDVIQDVSTSTKYYEFSYKVPKDDENVAGLIKTRADNWLKETNIKNVKNDSQAEQEFGIFEGMKYGYASDYKTFETTDYTTYLETILEFTGGAHPSTLQTSYVFSKKSGIRLNNLSDIYNDGIFSGLSKYTRENLPKELLKKDIKVSDFIDMFNDGTSASKANWSTFYFEGQSIIVVFGQYQIGPYVIGIHELKVPLSVLEKYKK